jgi:hypothetical protein
MVDNSDPLAKIARANEHIESLSRMITEFSNDAYSVDMQPDFWTEPCPPADGSVIITVTERQRPPSTLWGPVIGDIVHGLRSALDQLIWALSVDYQPGGPPADPIPRNSPWRDIWFPVCLSPQHWSDQQRKLWAVDPSYVAIIEAFQPFATGQQAPDREPLAVLQELWNIDKHRHLHLVNMTIELMDILSVEPFPGAPYVEFDVVSKRARGPLVGHAEIGRARLIPNKQVLAMTLPQMNMDPSIAVDIAFDQGAPAYGGAVLHTLREISQTTQAIVGAF